MRAYVLLFVFLPQRYALRLLTAEFKVSSTTSTATSSTVDETPAPGLLSGYNAPPTMKMGGAFGGGGCYSAISQLGFLRGLLADDIGNAAPAMKLTNIASSSGGSWALGMFFNSAKPGGLFDVYTTGERVETKGNEYFKNKLGKWCMYHNFHHSIPKKQWSSEMQFCGTYNLDKTKDSKDKAHIDKGEFDALFGVAGRCLKDENPFKGLLDLGTVRIQNGRDEFLELSGPGRQAWVAKKMQDQYEQFFKNNDETKEQWFSKKLSDLAPIFKSEKYGEVQWSIFYSHWKTIVPPVAMSSLSGASTGPATRSSDNLARAIFYSSDAYGAMAAAALLAAEISSSQASCKGWSDFLQDATQNDRYPFPFGDKFQTPPLSLLETQSTNVSSIKIPLHMLQNEKASSSDSLIEFFLNVSAEERRQALSSTLPAWNTDGLATDNNAVGAALRLMENVEISARPKTLVSLITGLIDKGNDFQVQEVLGYFKNKVKYGDLIPLIFPGVMEPLKCEEVRDLQVKNPNYFFKLEDWGVDGSLDESDQKLCNEEVMLSPKANSKCWNFRHQMETTGTVFAREVTVQKNELWGLTGGWKLTVMFTVLTTNDASTEWVNDIFPGDPNKAERDHLSSFPVMKDGKLSLMGVEPLFGFALMNYNAFKGYLTHCAMIHVQTQGKQECKYCAEEAEKEKKCKAEKKGTCTNDCKKWLPFLKHPPRSLL